jgi:peptidoglycan hydrolase-like protein with peptidoglycan-binding domain
MRIFAAILAALLGTAMAFAQSDPNVQVAPASGANAKAKSSDNRASGNKASGKKSARKHKPAEAKPKAAERKKPGRAKTKSKPTSEDKEDAATAKSKSKSAAADKPATTGSTGTASPEAKSGLHEAYAAIPFADRLAIQSDLIWTGDYNGLVDGQFSDRLVEAVTAYQKRQRSKATGVLSAQERAALSAAVSPRQEEIGWRLVEDPVIGARVGLPAKLATRSAPGPSGTRWSSAQGQLQIETFRIDTGATLEAVFEQQKTLPRRRVTANAMKQDFFVVSGTQGLKKFYVRAFAKDGEVRGLAILYDQAMEGTMDPLVAAMSNAFVPFASYAVASTTDAPRRKVEYGTGLVVNPSGYIVTARDAVDGCQVIAIPGLGNAERLAEDKDNGMALLRVYGARGLTPIQLHGVAPGGDSVTLVGIADPQTQAGGDAVTTALARLGADASALNPAPVLGFSGAAAFDGQGRLVGIAVHKSSIVAGAAVAPAAALVPFAKIRAFLDANYVAPAAGRPGIEGAKASAVRVICVRK